MMDIVKGSKVGYSVIVPEVYSWLPATEKYVRAKNSVDAIHEALDGMTGMLYVVDGVEKVCITTRVKNVECTRIPGRYLVTVAYDGQFQQCLYVNVA